MDLSQTNPSKEAETVDESAASYVFYPENKWGVALAGVVVSAGCFLGLSNATVGDHGTVNLEILAWSIGIVWGGLASIQAFSRYPRLLLTPHTLTVLSLLGSATVQLDEMGTARVFRRRHRLQTSIYLGFLTRGEEAALSQDRSLDPVQWSDMARMIYLTAFIYDDMKAAQSIADAVNMIRAPQERVPLDAHTVQFHLSGLKKRRFWTMAFIAALIVGLVLLKAL